MKSIRNNSISSARTYTQTNLKDKLIKKANNRKTTKTTNDIINTTTMGITPTTSSATSPIMGSPTPTRNMSPTSTSPFASLQLQPVHRLRSPIQKMVPLQSMLSPISPTTLRKLTTSRPFSHPTYQPKRAFARARMVERSVLNPEFLNVQIDYDEPRVYPNIEIPEGVTIVDDFESAQRVLKILMSDELRHNYHACDFETMNIDPKEQSPVGNGIVICASIFCGPDVDFGNGPRLWIDNMGAAKGVLDYFKEYFENDEILKVWHNYSFDRHVVYNHGIDVRGFGGDTLQMARLWNSSRTYDGGYSLEALSNELIPDKAAKISMGERFGRPLTRKDGSVGKVIVMPRPEDLQTDIDTRGEWMLYSVLDTEATWYLRNKLEDELRKWPWAGGLTMYNFYLKYWLPFGEMLTDMERNGIYVRRADYLPSLKQRAEADKIKYEKYFVDWAIKQNPEAKYMNPGSELQKQQFFFGPKDEKDKYKSGLPVKRAFETENLSGYIEPGKLKPRKNFTFYLTGLGFPIISRTPKGAPQSSMAVLKELAGDPDGKRPKFGKAYDHFGGGEAGEEACRAIHALIQLAAIDTLLSTFITTLMQQADIYSRIHCSLGLNTETGRLSSRRPNLQNQPALEKDIYKIRDAFAAPPGHKLIVADYGQLELRILAHITKCESMIEAFRLGGDFHSRTAMGMFQYIQDDVNAGEVLLEWDYSKGAPPKPLLKDKYASERRKAKIVNFSIAYGKTANGLAKDFDVTLAEARETLESWYRARPEVRDWQQKTIAEAHATGVTRTLMGRYRPLHGINDSASGPRGHAERAAINTPIQGGAADVVMTGMLKLHHDQRLRDIGWKILLQIHDELIVEGPEEYADQALMIVRDCMEHPFKKDLLVDLITDASIAQTWYEGK